MGLLLENNRERSLNGGMIANLAETSQVYSNLYKLEVEDIELCKHKSPFSLCFFTVNVVIFASRCTKYNCVTFFYLETCIFHKSHYIGYVIKFDVVIDN